MPKVSIIINCLNGEDYLEEALESVRRQTYTDYEIVFLDNHSTDNTGIIAKKFGEKLNYYCTEKTVSLGKARNIALEYSKGEYIAFLDSDDLWEKHKLQRQIDILERIPEIGVVHSNFNTLNMDTGEVAVVHKGRNDRIDEFEDFVLKYAYCLSTFMIRKALIVKPRIFFDERMQYAEEYDFFSRLMLNSKAYYIGIPLCTRRVHSAMNTLKLADLIPIEHRMTLNNLRNEVNDFDEKHPGVAKKINSVADYMECKNLLPKGENQAVRLKMRKYLFYDIRCTVYYIISFFPSSVSKILFRFIYRNHYEMTGGDESQNKVNI